MSERTYDTVEFRHLETHPAHWEVARRDDGWVVRLVGSNGEKMLASEVLRHSSQAVHTMQVARLSMPGAGLDSSSLPFSWVDERTGD